METIRLARELVRTLRTHQVEKILTLLEDGASMALEAGFRHVQLHAAHGYLFSLLIDDRIYDGAGDVDQPLGRWVARFYLKYGFLGIFFLHTVFGNTGIGSKLTVR